MKNLKNKLFYTILIILTISIITIITIFNIQNYIEKRNSINNNLNVSKTNENKNDDKIPPEKKDDIITKDKEPNIDENIKFMDTTIYTILLNEDNTIKYIINHSNNDITNEEITSIANKILDKSNIKERYIGCLYFNNYAYAYNISKSLIIIDITNIKTSLLISLFISTIVFIVLEIIVFIISKKITKWIIEPISETFNKQKEFIEDASHELKTPLSVIIASSDMIESDKKNSKWINNIKSESNRMSLLISDLLDLASTEHEETFNMELNNISKIIELTVLTFEGKAYENNIKLNYDIEPNIMIKFDENSIKQLIEILLDNAIKHSTKSNTINLYLKDNKNEIELKVENKGDIIPKGEEDKIFERFYRVDKSRNRKENRYGLGLAIAKNIVTKHNGIIKAYSTNDITTFKVLLKK